MAQWYGSIVWLNSVVLPSYSEAESASSRDVPTSMCALERMPTARHVTLVCFDKAQSKRSMDDVRWQSAVIISTWQIRRHTAWTAHAKCRKSPFNAISKMPWPNGQHTCPAQWPTHMPCPMANACPVHGQRMPCAWPTHALCMANACPVHG